MAGTVMHFSRLITAVVLSVVSPAVAAEQRWHITSARVAPIELRHGQYRALTAFDRRNLLSEAIGARRRFAGDADEGNRAVFFVELGHIYLLNGFVKDATITFASACKTLETLGVAALRSLARCQTGSAEAALKSGDRKTAEALANRALNLQPDADRDPVESARARYVLGRAAREPDEAIRNFGQAIELLRGTDRPVDLVLATEIAEHFIKVGSIRRSNIKDDKSDYHIDRIITFGEEVLGNNNPALSSLLLAGLKYYAREAGFSDNVRALAARLTVLARDDPDFDRASKVLISTAEILEKLELSKEAGEARMLELRLAEQQLGPHRSHTITSKIALGLFFLNHGDHEIGTKLIFESVESAEAAGKGANLHIKTLIEAGDVWRFRDNQRALAFYEQAEVYIQKQRRPDRAALSELKDKLAAVRADAAPGSSAPGRQSPAINSRMQTQEGVDTAETDPPRALYARVAEAWRRISSAPDPMEDRLFTLAGERIARGEEAGSQEFVSAVDALVKRHVRDGRLHDGLRILNVALEQRRMLLGPQQPSLAPVLGLYVSAFEDSLRAFPDAVTRIVQALSEADEPDASEPLVKMAGGYSRDNAVESLAAAYARQGNTTQALSVINLISSEPGIWLARRRVLSVLASTLPPDGFEIYLDTIEDQSLRESITSELASQAASVDTALVFRLLQKISTPKERFWAHLKAADKAGEISNSKLQQQLLEIGLTTLSQVTDVQIRINLLADLASRARAAGLVAMADSAIHQAGALWLSNPGGSWLTEISVGAGLLKAGQLITAVRSVTHLESTEDRLQSALFLAGNALKQKEHKTAAALSDVILDEFPKLSRLDKLSYIKSTIAIITGTRGLDFALNFADREFFKGIERSSDKDEVRHGLVQGLLYDHKLDHAILTSKNIEEKNKRISARLDILDYSLGTKAPAEAVRSFVTRIEEDLDQNSDDARSKLSSALANASIWTEAIRQAQSIRRKEKRVYELTRVADRLASANDVDGFHRCLATVITEIEGLEEPATRARAFSELAAKVRKQNMMAEAARLLERSRGEVTAVSRVYERLKMIVDEFAAIAVKYKSDTDSDDGSASVLVGNLAEAAENLASMGYKEEADRLFQPAAGIISKFHLDPFTWPAPRLQKIVIRTNGSDWIHSEVASYLQILRGFGLDGKKSVWEQLLNREGAVAEALRQIREAFSISYRQRIPNFSTITANESTQASYNPDPELTSIYIDLLAAQLKSNPVNRDQIVREFIHVFNTVQGGIAADAIRRSMARSLLESQTQDIVRKNDAWTDEVRRLHEITLRDFRAGSAGVDTWKNLKNLTEARLSLANLQIEAAKRASRYIQSEDRHSDEMETVTRSLSPDQAVVAFHIGRFGGGVALVITAENSSLVTLGQGRSISRDDLRSLVASVNRSFSSFAPRGPAPSAELGRGGKPLRARPRSQAERASRLTRIMTAAA